MALTSALTTALSGLTAAETQIDVVGNNLANAQTVGFKESDTIFATQFLQTLSLGSAPTTDSGGTDPMQIGRGVLVADISPDFTQGTIQVSSSSSDLAIQGDGFFIIEGTSGEQLYTRNGIFRTDALNQLVTVEGQRLLGFGVDDDFNLQTSGLVPLQVPLGLTNVAEATENVILRGTLTPSGDVADTAEVIETPVLGNRSIPRPDVSSTDLQVAPNPDASGSTANSIDGGGSHPENVTYRYRITFVDDSGTETMPSDEIVVSIPVGDTLANNSIQLNNLPDSSTHGQLNIYRTAPNGTSQSLLTTLNTASNGGPTAFVDDNSLALGAALDDSSLSGNYSYLLTFYRSGEQESRPSVVLGPASVVDGRVRLSNLPTPPVPGPGDLFPPYDQIRVYRNVTGDANTFYRLATLNPGQTFTDNVSDAVLVGNPVADLDGPKATADTLLTDLVLRDDNLSYEQLFETGTLNFSGKKGGQSLAEKQLQITSTTTLQELLDFMEDSTGIQSATDDPLNPIPTSVNEIPGDGSGALASGASVLSNGRLRIVSNNGVDNAVTIGSTSFTLETDTGEIISPNMVFDSVQGAKGQSAVADFLVYDTLGAASNVRVTAVLEERTGAQTTYRWFADSSDNDPLSGTEIAVGTGLISFDGEGNLLTTSNETVAIDRRNSPAASPLAFDLDFSEVSGLAVESSTLAATSQDGSPPGTLNSFSIGEDGVVRGAFDNGVTRTLGQIRMVRFANAGGLEQLGDNLFAEAPNSGLPVQGNPGQNGIGRIISGAVELSNTNIGQNLIELVLATTQYRGNTRVITVAQQLFDELLNLRR